MISLCCMRILNLPLMTWYLATLTSKKLGSWNFDFTAPVNLKLYYTTMEDLPRIFLREDSWRKSCFNKSWQRGGKKYFQKMWWNQTRKSYPIKACRKMHFAIWRRQNTFFRVLFIMSGFQEGNFNEIQYWLECKEDYSPMTWGIIIHVVLSILSTGNNQNMSGILNTI